ncbi:MAG: response regulator transcription factor [Planctomycetota bacterium]
MVVDDHEAIRVGLAEYFQGTQINLVAATNNGEEAFQQLEKSELDLDVILMDVQLPETDGLALLVKLRSGFPNLSIVLFSAFDYHVYVARAVANGAHDYVLKCDSMDDLCKTLVHVNETSQPLPGGRLDRVKKRLADPPSPGDLPAEIQLTQREMQVLRHIAFGLSNKEIAISLSISVETVKEHVQNVLRKFDAKDRTDAAVKAVRFGLAD